MHKKTISLALCLAATVDSAAAGVSKIESADDFTWDNANVYFLLTDRFYNGDTSNDHSYGRALDANGNPLSGWQSAPGTFHGALTPSGFPLPTSRSTVTLTRVTTTLPTIPITATMFLTTPRPTRTSVQSRNSKPW